MDAGVDELASSSDDEAFPAIDLETIILPGKDGDPPIGDPSYELASDSAVLLQPLPHHVFTIYEDEAHSGSDGPSDSTGGSRKFDISQCDQLSQPEAELQQDALASFLKLPRRPCAGE